MSEDQCTCHEPQEEHYCPYQADVNNDPDYRCTCCPYCTGECADDI